MTEAAAAQPGSERPEVTGELVLGLFTEFASTDGPVTREARLEDLAIDSLDLVELVEILDEEHGVRLDRDAFAEVVTVGDALDEIERCAREAGQRG